MCDYFLKAVYILPKYHQYYLNSIFRNTDGGNWFGSLLYFGNGGGEVVSGDGWLEFMRS